MYEELRPLLFSIAYRMVGSASEAEDIVQEAFVRFHDQTSKGADIESPKARLSTVTTRLAINHLQSARVRRETYNVVVSLDIADGLVQTVRAISNPAKLRHLSESEPH